MTKGHMNGMCHFDHDHDHGHTHEHTHEGGECHCHEHTHDGDHAHTHSHDHEHSVPEQASESVKRAFKMLSYMYHHNCDHAQELEDMGLKLQELGETEAAEVIAAAVADFKESNEKLHNALHHLG